MIGSTATVILLEGWTLPVGGVASEGAAPAACAAGLFIYWVPRGPIGTQRYKRYLKVQ